jgi:hypothetical protein
MRPTFLELRVIEPKLTASGKKSQLVTSGSVDSKLNHYFNSPCFTTPSVTGADGIGSAFGDSGTGIANGPSQANGDFSLSKTTGLTWLREGSALLFRAEFFNALNHPPTSGWRTHEVSLTKLGVRSVSLGSPGSRFRLPSR